MDTRFVFSAQPRERLRRQYRCRKDRLKRARDPLFMSCLTQGHTQRLWGLSRVGLKACLIGRPTTSTVDMFPFAYAPLPVTL